MELQTQIEEMEKLLHETHNLVQKMYTIVVGNEEYKDASIIAQVNMLRNKVEELERDKIRRDAKLQLLSFLSSVVGAGIALIVNYLLKK